jgi:hypothetical protein
MHALMQMVVSVDGIAEFLQGISLFLKHLPVSNGIDIFDPVALLRSDLLDSTPVGHFIISSAIRILRQLPDSNAWADIVVVQEMLV